LIRLLRHKLVAISELHGRRHGLLRKVERQIFQPNQFGSALEGGAEAQLFGISFGSRPEQNLVELL
jgi:hypothetical protein